MRGSGSGCSRANEVLRRASAYLSQANLSEKALYPLVKEVAAVSIAGCWFGRL